MGNLRPSALPAFGATLALTLSAASCLPITNVFDPSGPPDSLALTFVNGSLAFDDGAPLDGVVVDIYREGGGGDAGGGERVTASFVASDGRDAFSFEVAPDVTRVVIQTNRCGYDDVSIDIPDAYPEYAANLTPGSEFDINDGRPVVLRRDPPSRTITGRVEALDETASESGIKVSLVEVGTDGACREAVAEVTTDEAGAFSLSPIADGRYVAVAFTEGTTVAISDVVDSCAFATEPDGTVPDVEIPLLSIRGGSGALALTGSSTDNPDLPAGVIAEPRVNVLVGGFFEWADEMRLSEDPTFASGSTGWVPVQSPRLYPSAGQLRGNTETTVFGQFRSACALSPLYSASVVYDGRPPDISLLRLLDVNTTPDADAGTWRGTSAVIVDELVAIPLAVDAVDETGIQGELTIGQGDTVLSTQVLALVAGEGLLSLREQIDLPLDEGRYEVALTLRDGAGNQVRDGDVPRVYRWDLIRDTSPPTTPIPAVSSFSLDGQRAVLWLEERPCLTGPPALVCEANKPDANFFQVRGGELLDFVGFDNPPFIVPLREGMNTIEIRAVDLAGNPSESTAVVEVERTGGRVLTTLPAEYVLGGAAGEELGATNGVAFFRASPNPLNPPASAYEYLLAQPADLPSLGLDAAQSPLPRGIRKLSTDQDLNQYSVAYGPHGAGAGRLAWLEGRELNIIGHPYGAARMWMTLPDEDGRFPISVLQSLSLGGVPYLDDEGDVALPVFEKEYCRVEGQARCTRSQSWRWLSQRAPASLAVSGRFVAVSGSGMGRLASIDGPSADTLEVTGPMFVANRVVVPEEDLVVLTEMRIAAQTTAGSSLGVDVLTGTTSYISEGNSKGAYRAATGSGWETLRFSGGAVFRTDDTALVGVLVPEGVTATFDLVSIDEGVDAGAPGAGNDGFMQALGMVAVPYETYLAFSTYHRTQISGFDVQTAFVSEEAVRMDLVRVDRSDDGEGSVSGVTIVDLGDNRQLDLTERTEEELDDDVPDPPADDELSPLLRPRAVTDTPTTAEDEPALVDAEEGCASIVEVTQPLKLLDVELGGYGELDDVFLFVYRRDGAGLVGSYQPAPIFAGGDHYVNLRAPAGTGGCDQDLNTSTISETFTVTSSAPELTQLNVAGDALTSASGTALLGAEVQLLDFAIAEGEQVVVKMSGLTAGDADLYVGVDGPPSLSIYDCAPLLGGSNEQCSLVGPPGGATIYVMASGWSGDVDVNVAVGQVQQVQQLPVPAGRGVDVTSTGAGDLDLYIALDAVPSPVDNDDSSTNADANESASTATGGDPETLSIAVAFFEPTTATLDIAVIEQLVTLGNWPVRSGQDIAITAGDAQPSTVDLYVQYDQPPTLADYETRDTFSPLSIFRRPVDPNTSSVFVAVTPEATPYDITLELDVIDIGCELVKSQASLNPPFAPSATADLEVGTYALVLAGSSVEDSALPFPDTLPRVRRSAPAPDTERLIFHGNAAPPVVGQTSLNIGELDGGDPCDLRLVLSARAELEAVAVSDTLHVTSLIERSPTEPDRRVLEIGENAALRSASPLTYDQQVSLELGDRRLFAVEAYDDAVRWIESDLEGGSAQVWSLPRAALNDPSPAPCLLVDVEATGGPLIMTAGSLSGDRAHLAGAGSAASELRSYALGAPGSCLEGTFAGREQLSAAPVAIAGDDTGVFLALAATTASEGPSILHHSTSAATPLYAGGELEVTSFDVGAERLAFTLAPRADVAAASAHRLVLVDAPNGVFDDPSVVARAISSPAILLHPTFLNDDHLALIAAEAGQPPALEIWDLSPLANGEPITTTPVDAADAVLDAISPYDAALPLDWARKISLRRMGERLAVLAFGEGGGELIVLDAAGSPDTWSSLTGEILMIPDHGAAPSGISGDEDLLLISYEDGSSDLVYDDGGDLAVSVDDGGQARLMGLGPDGPLAVQRPAGLYGRKPDAMAAVLSGTPGTDVATWTTVGSLPTLAAVHSFGGAISLGDRLLVIDRDAEPPVVWSLPSDGGPVQTADGPYRPLLTGAEGLGPNARIVADDDGMVFVKRTATGNALWWVRPD